MTVVWRRWEHSHHFFHEGWHHFSHWWRWRHLVIEFWELSFHEWFEELFERSPSMTLLFPPHLFLFIFTVTIFLRLFNEFHFHHVVTVLNVCLTYFTEIEIGDYCALISDSKDWFNSTTSAFDLMPSLIFVDFWFLFRLLDFNFLGDAGN